MRNKHLKRIENLNAQEIIPPAIDVVHIPMYFVHHCIDLLHHFEQLLSQIWKPRPPLNNLNFIR